MTFDPPISNLTRIVRDCPFLTMQTRDIRTNDDASSILSAFRKYIPIYGSQFEEWT